MEDLEFHEWLIRLLIATALSGAIGFEREAQQKAAGLRTHMLVGLGAALFALVSVTAFDMADPSRVAAQVVTGVGFLGAGAIFRLGASVRGLTTAAGLWAVAAIGLAAGTGQLLVALTAAVVGLVVLYGLTVVESYMRSKTQPGMVTMSVVLERGGNIAGLVEAVGRVDPSVDDIRFRVIDAETVEVSFVAQPDRAPTMTAVAASVEGVLSAERADRA